MIPKWSFSFVAITLTHTSLLSASSSLYLLSHVFTKMFEKGEKLLWSFHTVVVSATSSFYLAGNWHEDVEEGTRSRLPNVPKSCNHNSLKTYNDDGDNTSMTDQHGDPLHPASSSSQIFCTTSTNTAIGLPGTQKISVPTSRLIPQTSTSASAVEKPLFTLWEKPVYINMLCK